MGDIADSIINGEVCQICGVPFKYDVGYPATCKDCSRGARPIRSDKPKNPTTGKNAVNGILNFIKGKGLHEDDLDVVLAKYRLQELILVNKDSQSLEREFICSEIQKDFGKFVKWFKENY